MNVNSIFSQLGVPAGMMQDVIFFLVVILASFILAMLIGKHRVVNVIINTYITFAILQVVPAGYLTSFTSTELFFFVLLIILTLLGDKLFEISISGAGFMWRVIVASFLEVLLLSSLALSFMPKKEALGYVSKLTYPYLTAPDFRLLLMVAPLAFLLLIHKKLSH